MGHLVLNCHGNSIETQMSGIHTQLIFNSEMSMRASLIRLILSVRPFSPNHAYMVYISYMVLPIEMSPIWLAVMVIGWRSFDSWFDVFTFLNFLNILFSISFCKGTEGPFNCVRLSEIVLIRGASSIWWRCVFFNGKAIISTERTPSSCFRIREKRK